MRTNGRRNGTDPLIQTYAELLAAVIERARLDAVGRFVYLGADSASAVQRDAREWLPELYEILNN